MATRRRAAKRNGSRRILNLSALDLENLAQAELYRYFEPVPGLWNPDDPMTPQPRTHGGRLGLAPAARAYIYPEARARVLFELDRLIRRDRFRQRKAVESRGRAIATDAAKESLGWDNPEGRKWLKDKIARDHPLPRYEPALTREAWLLWKAEHPPRRETLARWNRGSSRRDLHACILKRHRSVRRAIAGHVARLSPDERLPGRLFRFVYQRDRHSLKLTFSDPTPTA